MPPPAAPCASTPPRPHHEPDTTRQRGAAERARSTEGAERHLLMGVGASAASAGQTASCGWVVLLRESATVSSNATSSTGVVMMAAFSDGGASQRDSTRRASQRHVTMPDREHHVAEPVPPRPVPTSSDCPDMATVSRGRDDIKASSPGHETSVLRHRPATDPTP